MENQAELIVVLAKSMPLGQIVMELAKYSANLNSDLKAKRVEPNLASLSTSPNYQGTLTFSQLLISKLAYEKVDLLDAMKDIKEFRDEFDMKQEVDKLRGKQNN